MNTIDNNKLIAEFIGLEKENELYLFTTLMDDYKTDTLYFDTSWDWLMPVVEKCLTTDGRHYTLNDALLTCNIKEVYQAAVQFINQYNNQQL